MAKLPRQATLSRRLYHVATVGYFLISLIGTISVLCHHWLTRNFGGLSNLLTFVQLFAMIGSSYALFSWRRINQEMAASADIRDIGAFIDGLQMRGGVSRLTLIRLLPEMRASDAALLQDHHRAALRGIVGGRRRNRSNIPLVTAILKAYEQVGGEGDVPVVEVIARGHGYGKYEEVRHAAEDGLPSLRASALQHQQQVTLLRASSANDAGDTQLLRPAGTADTNDSQLMLRASSVKV